MLISLKPIPVNLPFPKKLPVRLIRTMERFVYAWSVIEILMIVMPKITPPEIGLLLGRSVALILFFTTYYFIPEEDIEAGEELVEGIIWDEKLPKKNMSRLIADSIATLCMMISFCRLIPGIHPLILIFIFLTFYVGLQLRLFDPENL